MKKKETVETPAEKKLKKPAVETWENEGGEIPKVSKRDSTPSAIPEAPAAKEGPGVSR